MIYICLADGLIINFIFGMLCLLVSIIFILIGGGLILVTAGQKLTLEESATRITGVIRVEKDSVNPPNGGPTTNIYRYYVDNIELKGSAAYVGKMIYHAGTEVVITVVLVRVFCKFVLVRKSSGRRVKKMMRQQEEAPIAIVIDFFDSKRRQLEA